jgi:hypothetical protein
MAQLQPRHPQLRRHPTKAHVGNLNLKLTATDGSGASITDTFQLQVKSGKTLGTDSSGDGKTDLLWKQDGVNGVGAYYMELRNGLAPVAGGNQGYTGWSLADASADYNGDGKTDLMWKQDGVNGAGAYYMELRDGLAAGTGQTLGYAGWSLIDTNGDYNGDGKADLMWKQDGANSYYMELRNGTAPIAGQQLGYAGWSLIDANADYDGDGKTDLMWKQDGASGAGAYYLELRNGLTPGYGSTLGYAGWSLIDTSADYNGDGKTDLLWKQDGASGAGAYYMELRNGLTAGAGSTLGYAGYSLIDANGDYNGDGKTDLMWKQDGVSGAGAYYMELRNGLTPGAGSTLGYTGWSLIDVNGDYNGDGKTDLMWKQDGVTGAGAYYMELRNGLTPDAGQTLGYAGSTYAEPKLDLSVLLSIDKPAATTVAPTRYTDFNQDGKTDLMWKQDGASGANAYYLELRNGTTPIAGGASGYTGWSLIDANGDYNGDGKTDLLWKQDGVNGAGAYYMELRNGTAPGAGQHLGYAGWSLVDASGDYNGDGKADLMWKQDGVNGAGAYYMELPERTGRRHRADPGLQRLEPDRHPRRLQR